MERMPIIYCIEACTYQDLCTVHVQYMVKQQVVHVDNLPTLSTTHNLAIVSNLFC